MLDRRIKTLTRGYTGPSTHGQTVHGVVARDLLTADMLADGFVLTEQVGEELVFEQDAELLRINKGKAIVAAAQDAWAAAGVKGLRPGPRPTVESVAANLAAGRPAYTPVPSDLQVEVARREALGDQGRDDEDREKFLAKQMRDAANLAGARSV